MSLSTEVLIGTPTQGLTRDQAKVHKRLARAEKRYIAAVIWEEDPQKVAEFERRCNVLTRTWKKVTA